MTERPTIHRYLDLEASPQLQSGLDAVFFESSNTKVFASDEDRAAFRERWLGRYLGDDARFAHVARDAAGDIAGYVVGAIDDPALAPRFADIPYFVTFGALTRSYPAHLHVNLASAYRGQGLGGLLVDLFCRDARRAGATGVHVVTSRGARNVGFYDRLGFAEAGSAGEGAQAVVFLAKKI